jgi:hypothetical protein
VGAWKTVRHNWVRLDSRSGWRKIYWVRLQVGGGQFTGCACNCVRIQQGAPTNEGGYNRVCVLQLGVATAGCVLQLDAATARCGYSLLLLQLGAATAGCGYSWVRLQLGAATAGCGYNWVRLQLGAATITDGIVRICSS